MVNAIVSTHIVKVAGKSCEVQTRRTSLLEWHASGDYAGHFIDSTDRTEEAAVSAWQKGADYHAGRVHGRP
jgi:hypothetical protein